MLDIQDQTYCPTLEELGDFVGNDLFNKFCSEISARYQTDARIEYSKCSMARGWNIKYKKAGKSLCTIYPREQFFTVLVVIGQKEKEQAEELLSECDPLIREVYHRTQEGNGQRWLMIDLEDENGVFEDVLRLIKIRRSRR